MEEKTKITVPIDQEQKTHAYFVTMSKEFRKYLQEKYPEDLVIAPPQVHVRRTNIVRESEEESNKTYSIIKVKSIRDRLVALQLEYDIIPGRISLLNNEEDKEQIKGLRLRRRNLMEKIILILWTYNEIKKYDGNISIEILDNKVNVEIL